LRQGHHLLVQFNSGVITPPDLDRLRGRERSIPFVF
jgi:hypothetical protein